jgi:hypothetical protein
MLCLPGWMASGPWNSPQNTEPSSIQPGSRSAASPAVDERLCYDIEWMVPAELGILFSEPSAQLFHHQRFDRHPKYIPVTGSRLAARRQVAVPVP